MFEGRGPGVCISAGDAQAVEIIHSSAGKILLRGAVGDQDYYPNGGSFQPGCPINNNGEMNTCSHSRGYELYVESITNLSSLLAIKCKNYKKFLAGDCKNNAIIVSLPGADTVTKIKGSYFLKTKDKSPFGMGKQGYT